MNQCKKQSNYLILWEVNVEAQRKTTGFEIAVIGMAGGFPGARNINEYWSNLKNGVESISFLSDEELKEAAQDGKL